MWNHFTGFRHEDYWEYPNESGIDIIGETASVKYRIVFLKGKYEVYAPIARRRLDDGTVASLEEAVALCPDAYNELKALGRVEL